MHLEAAGLDPGHVEKLGNQPGDPVGIGVDRLEHDPLLVVGEAVPLGQQRGGEPLDAGQGRAQFVRDGGHEISAAALDPGEGGGAPQADGQPSHLVAVAPLARVPDGDEHFRAVGEVKRELRVPGPDVQAVVRVGAYPPVPPVTITQRQDVTDVGAEGVGRGDTCQPPRRAVEHGHPAGLVGKHQAIGQVVGTDQATRAPVGLRESLAVAAMDCPRGMTPGSPRRPRRLPWLGAAAPGVREGGAWVNPIPPADLGAWSGPLVRSLPPAVLASSSRRHQAFDMRPHPPQWRDGT